MASSKRILLLAYMFPPIIDGGGFRPAAFARYLPEFGYSPLVLTRPDTSGLPVDPNQLTKLPGSVEIVRVPVGYADGWTRRFRNRYRWTQPVERMLRRPDHWIADAIAWRSARRDHMRVWEVSWMEPAVDVATRLIEQHDFHAIVATAPPFESLKAGLLLAQ